MSRFIRGIQLREGCAVHSFEHNIWLAYPPVIYVNKSVVSVDEHAPGNMWNVNGFVGIRWIDVLILGPRVYPYIFLSQGRYCSFNHYVHYVETRFAICLAPSAFQSPVHYLRTCQASLDLMNRCLLLVSNLSYLVSIKFIISTHLWTCSNRKKT